MVDILTSIEKVHLRNLKYFRDPLRKLIKGRLWLQIILAMVLGVAAGIALSPDTGWVSTSTAQAVGGWLALPGQLFLAVIQMIVVPLILASIIRGIAAATDVQQLKSTGLWVMAYFLGTTVMAVVIGISLGLVLRPGSYVDASALEHTEAHASVTQSIVNEAEKAAETKEPVTIGNLPEQLIGILPTNPISSIAQGQMLQIVIFAVIVGIGLLSLTPEAAKPLLELMGSIQGVCMAVVGALMTIAPLAVFGLLSQAMIKTGPQVLTGLGTYAGSVVLGMAILLVVYTAIAVILGNVRPRRFLSAIREPILLAFSTDSSAATMPITIKSAEEKLRVRPSLTQFIVPLGATVNMGGTALYQGLATIFMAQMFQMDLPLSALVALVATALGASVGTPAVPGVGIIVLATVLNSAGIPLAGLALIIGVDQILERFRTSLNVTGDLVACTVMDRFMPARLTKTEELQVARDVAREQRREEVDVVVAE
jgi:Na+/H+-dicarboxylate symporter